MRTTVDYQGSAQEAVVVQRAGFRTRGLPGPQRGRARRGSSWSPTSSRSIPAPPACSIAASRSCSRSTSGSARCCRSTARPHPSDPAERTQLLEWVLAVEQADGRRLSVPTADWIVAHRGTAPPPRRWVPRVIDDVLVRADVRRAPTIAPLAQRLEALELLSPSCDQTESALHASQILTHAPLDPAAADPTVPLWPSRTTLRAAVRAKAGAHVSRRPFDDGDETALTVADEGRITSTAWQHHRRRARRIGHACGRVAALCRAGRAELGSLQIHAEVDPAGGAVGVAVAVSGLPRVERALVALVDAASGRLRLLARRGGATEDLTSTPLPAGSVAPYALEVLVFDDRVRARVGETSVEAVRGDLRDGRVAVVIDGPGRCSALHIDGLDGHVSQLTTSRFAGFEEHIASWDGVPRPLPGDAGAVPALRAATIAEITAVDDVRRRSAGPPAPVRPLGRRTGDPAVADRARSASEQRRQCDAGVGDAGTVAIQPRRRIDGDPPCPCPAGPTRWSVASPDAVRGRAWLRSGHRGGSRPRRCRHGGESGPYPGARRLG